MKILIIDSHKGSLKQPDNLHWLNAFKIKEFLISRGDEVDLIWSYPTVNDNIQRGYNAIVFNHASHYSYVDYEWLQKSSDAKLFYISNEYNLGEPRTIWMAAKTGRKYQVISNHKPEISKVVKKYVSDWHVENLNALVVEESPINNNGLNPIIYYGSFRKGREKYFRKYLSGDKICISTHKKNRDKFLNTGTANSFIDRIKWSGEKNRLSDWMFSLYIEDEITHNNYNFLANRFYEALNHNTIPVFTPECLPTVELSTYEDFPHFEMLDSFNEEEYSAYAEYLPAWRKKSLDRKRIFPKFN